MEEKKAVFDANQGHGDHLDSILDGIEIQDFLKTLPDLIENAGVIGKTDGKISCTLGEEYPPEIEFALLGDVKNAGRVSVLLGCSINDERHELLSFYPEYDGVEVEIKLTAIHEWSNGVEATLEGVMLNGERNVAFFDTRYCLNKNNYCVGGSYIFKLSAFVYHKAEILQDPIFKLEGNDAVDFLHKVGGKIEYESDGSVKPVVCDMGKMVAFLQTSTEYPHLAEFQSPVFGIEEKKMFNGNFYKFDIVIANENDEKIIIPLIAKKSLFEETPQTDDPLRGMAWIQGYFIASAVAQKDENEEYDESKISIHNIRDWSYNLAKDNAFLSELNSSRYDVFEQIYQAWLTLDCSCFKEYLTPDFEYGSFWVHDPMIGADAYLEYINGKFESIRKSNAVPSVERVLLHSGKSPVGYNYALRMSQGDNQTLLLFSFDGNKISKLYMTNPELYQFVPCAEPILDKNGEAVIFQAPKKFFKWGKMHKKDFYAFALDSYAKILESQRIKVIYSHIYAEKDQSFMILEAQDKRIHLFCDIFAPPFSDGQTHLDEMEDFVKYTLKQNAVPAFVTLGMFCLDTNGEKAIYGGNFAMKASQMLFL